MQDCSDVKHDLYEKYYKITGLWWVKIDNMLSPLRQYLMKKRREEDLLCIHNWFERFLASDYVKITCDTNSYLKNPNARTLKRLICDYLSIFDFVNAFYYMDEYIQKRFWNYKRYIKMKQDLKSFIKWIKKSLKDREDILLFWIDCTSYEEFEWFPELMKRAEKSYFFEHAYPPTPTTTPVMMAINNKWLNIDDFSKYFKLRSSGFFDFHSSLLLQKIRKYGYDFAYFTPKSMTYPVYVESLLHRPTQHKYVSSNRLFFDAINQMMRTDKKQFMIIHCLAETHFPFWYPAKNGKMLYNVPPLKPPSSDELKQVCGASQYLDKQLAFYSDLLGDGTSRIYMSDHGKLYYQEEQYKRWGNKLNHTLFFIQSKYVPIEREKRIFTLYNFLELADALLRAHKSNSMADFEPVFDKDYIKVQSIEIYGKNVIDMYKDINYLESARPYRGIRTLEDYYLRFRNSELYYRNGDEETNLIDDPKYASRIAELRELAGTYFLDIEKKEKFKHARIFLDL